MEFKTTLKSYQEKVESALDTYLPSGNQRPPQLHQAMLHSMNAGGKRIRPVLVLAGSELFPQRADPLPAAVAIECLHTYTLIHDDLPAVDNADLRRGKPTCHKAFDEATAILAGDALLTYSFQLLSRHYQSTPDIGLKLVHCLSEASGSERLIGGQMEDILGESREINASDLDYIHQNKTAALLTAALKMGIIHGKCNQRDLETAEKLGYHMGLTFQIIDDILDATSNAQTLGKNVGQDEEAEKNTYVKFHGLEASRQKAKALTQEALNLCQAWPVDTTFLEDLIKYLEKRIF